jgi:hypothetical protein
LFIASGTSAHRQKPEEVLAGGALSIVNRPGIVAVALSFTLRNPEDGPCFDCRLPTKHPSVFRQCLHGHGESISNRIHSSFKCPIHPCTKNDYWLFCKIPRLLSVANEALRNSEAVRARSVQLNDLFLQSTINCSTSNIIFPWSSTRESTTRRKNQEARPRL